MDVRASIVTYNNADSISACLDSIPDGVPVSVIDNDSADNTVEIIKTTYPHVELTESPTNLGFGAGHNVNYSRSSEPFILVLNPDAWLIGGCLETLLAEIKKDPALALVAPRMEYENGAPQLSFGNFPCPVNDIKQKKRTLAVQAGDENILAELEEELSTRLEPDWVSGACFLARRESLDETGFFDEDYFLYLEDVDLCKRLRRSGRSVALTPQAVCRHLEGHSLPQPGASNTHYRKSRLIYENKWGNELFFWLYKIWKAKDVDLRFDKSKKV